MHTRVSYYFVKPRKGSRAWKLETLSSPSFPSKHKGKFISLKKKKIEKNHGRILHTCFKRKETKEQNNVLMDNEIMPERHGHKIEENECFRVS